MDNTLFLILDAPVIGEVHKSSIKIDEELCSKCKQRKLEFTDLSIVVDSWGGEDYFIIFNMHFITERLKIAFQEKGIKGVEYEEVKVQTGDYFEFREGAYQKEMPRVYKLIYKNELKTTDLWWDKLEDCSNCGRSRWEMNEMSLFATSRPSLNGGKDDENPPLRRVNKKDWKGEDMFTLNDPDKTPIITKKFLDIVLEIHSKEFFVRPTSWI
ncbi:MAG: hypothetical protein HRT69_14625 [Flavobacteriaceae bacterium]|nr:hypothetical protein [Flavobacteriaceae bacterium]